MDNVLLNATQNLVHVMQAEEREAASVKARIEAMVNHIADGGSMRTPPLDWRAFYPDDDPRNEPDLWASDVGVPVDIWLKLEVHQPVAYPPERQAHPRPGLMPFGQSDKGSPCGWCGVKHDGPMYVYTFMLPRDY